MIVFIKQEGEIGVFTDVNSIVPHHSPSRSLSQRGLINLQDIEGNVIQVLDPSKTDITILPDAEKS